MSTMKAAQFPAIGADLEIVEKPVPTPGKNQVLIKTEACGVCHSDEFAKQGAFDPFGFPRVPGHEIVGKIAKLGEGVTQFKEGQRVGVGWHGSHCFSCSSCKTGDFNLCDSSVIPGVTADGGYAEYVVADETGVAVVPEGIEAAEAAPLLCAGVTVFNALRNAGARPGDLVVVQGVGGLGHLAIQYAAKSGFKVVAVSGSDSKKELATQLGAHVYVDASKENPVNVIRKLGGARVVLATAPNADAMSKLVPCLGRNGNFIILGVSMEPVKVSPLTLISNRASVSGWPSGTAQDSEDTLKFSVMTDIKPLIQTFPLEKAQEAYTACMENKARFRSVIVFE